MKVSVAVCTWNRADLLDRTLLEFNRLDVPAGVSWELLVVNNNCTDHTDDVIARYESQLPIRRVFEPEPGHSNARNAAAASAQGELIIWTDDDVLVDPQWLAAYVKAARRHPEAAFFGGQIEPWFEREPPAWVFETVDRFGGVYAIRRLGSESFAFTADRLPFGANYAIRTAIQRQFTYDPNLGRRGSCMLSGEETELVLQLLAAGYEGWWLPDCRVRHFIPVSRMTTAYVRRFFFGLGRTDVLTSRRTKYRPRLASAVEALVAEGKWRSRRLVCPASRWVPKMALSAYLWGQLFCRRSSVAGRQTAAGELAATSTKAA